MIRFKANLYRGADSQRQPVTVLVDDQQRLRIIATDGVSRQPASYALADIEVSSRLGNTPRWLTLADGNKLETLANDAVDQALKAANIRQSGWLQRLESRWRWVLLLVTLVAGGAWGFSVYGLPLLARQAAYALPEEMSRTLGQQTLDSLDRLVFQPSQLAAERQQQLQRRFRQLLAELDGELSNSDDYRLLFRHSPRLGANALALPSGTLVVTDALVELASSELQLVSVLAHEIGHVEHRHALRRAIQSSVLPLIIISISGDVSSATSLVATLPTLALEAGYSQQFEREADAFALRYLQQNQLSAEPFIRLLQRLEERHPQQSTLFLSTHPTTRERIQALADGT